ncbi:MAG: hypothetical protein II628_05210, partial [Lachnospiraceae bacterium]|nr:hypothetical protein [Lachnospiraceae bacterium]
MSRAGREAAVPGRPLCRIRLRQFSKGCIMTRRNIDFASYPRKDHFEHFMAMENPFANVTVRVDITDWIRWLKEKEYPFFLTF